MSEEEYHCEACGRSLSSFEDTDEHPILGGGEFHCNPECWEEDKGQPWLY